MAHEVNATFHKKVVGNKDIEVNVKKDGSKLGTLLISKGNIEWLPSPKSVKRSRFSWRKFAAIMVSEGKPIRKKKQKKG
jgi:hypothetical protein